MRKSFSAASFSRWISLISFLTQADLLRERIARLPGARVVLGWDCLCRWRFVFAALGLTVLEGEQFGVESWRILLAS
jgi:hypothetical protein